MRENKTKLLPEDIAPFFLIDATSEEPKLDPKGKRIKKTKLVKRLEHLIELYSPLELEEDIQELEFILKKLRPLKVPDYNDLVSDIYWMYAPDVIHEEVENNKKKEVKGESRNQEMKLILYSPKLPDSFIQNESDEPLSENYPIKSRNLFSSLFLSPKKEKIQNEES